MRPGGRSWILSGFLLSASICTPIVGKLGDVYGKGRVLTLTLLVFSAGGVVCALSHSIALLIAGRVIQGVAGGVFPLAFGIIRDTFPPERVASGLGLVSAILGIGAGIGLPLSGVIADGLGIEWLFWISLIALPAALAAHRLVPPSPASRRLRIDWLGAAILSRGARGHPARGDRGQRLGLGVGGDGRADGRRRRPVRRLGVGRVARAEPLIELASCADVRWRARTSPGFWSGSRCSRASC